LGNSEPWETSGNCEHGKTHSQWACVQEMCGNDSEHAKLVTILVFVSLGFDFLHAKGKITKTMQEKGENNKKSIDFSCSLM
jgi:hypothetical protein